MESIKMLCYDFPDKEYVTLHGLADTHIGSPQFERAKLEKHLAKIMSDPNSYLVLAGDLIDNGLKGSKTNVYRQTMSPDEQIDLAGSLFEPYKDRILCLDDGNHERRSVLEADISPTRLLAYRLGLSDRYHRIMSFLRISVGQRRNGHVDRPVYTVAVHHGASSNVHTQNNYAVSCGADVFMTGHTHRPRTEPLERYEMDLQQKVARLKPIYMCVLTSWMRYGDYGAEKMLKPNGVHPNWVKLYGGERQVEVTQS